MVVGMQHQQQQPHASPATVLEDATTPCAVSPQSQPPGVTPPAISVASKKTECCSSSESSTPNGVVESKYKFAKSSESITMKMNEMPKSCSTYQFESNGRVKLRDVNPHLVCVLCHGYFVDATSIAECLHSFCRSCIILYLSTKSYCPICEVQINSSKLHLSLKLDKTLQDIVYKLVPGLFHAEMKRRNKFYQVHPNRDLDLHPEFRGITVDRLVYSPQDSICISLVYYDKNKEKEEWETMASRVSLGTAKSTIDLINNSDSDGDDDSPKKYLMCPAAVRVMDLKKLIRMKYSLDGKNKIELFFRRESLPDDYSLIDIAYIYAWKRNSPMRLYFKISIVTTVSESSDVSSPVMIEIIKDVKSSHLSPSSDLSNTFELKPNLTTEPRVLSNQEAKLSLLAESSAPSLGLKESVVDVKTTVCLTNGKSVSDLKHNDDITTIKTTSLLQSKVGINSLVTTIPSNTTTTAVHSTPRVSTKQKVPHADPKKCKQKNVTNIVAEKPMDSSPIKSYLAISSIMNEKEKTESKIVPLTKNSIKKVAMNETNQVVASVPDSVSVSEPTTTHTFVKASSLNGPVKPTTTSSISASSMQVASSNTMVTITCTSTKIAPHVTQAITVPHARIADVTVTTNASSVKMSTSVASPASPKTKSLPKLLPETANSMKVPSALPVNNMKNTLPAIQSSILPVTRNVTKVTAAGLVVSLSSPATTATTTRSNAINMAKSTPLTSSAFNVTKTVPGVKVSTSVASQTPTKIKSLPKLLPEPPSSIKVPWAVPVSNMKNALPATQSSILPGTRNVTKVTAAGLMVPLSSSATPMTTITRSNTTNAAKSTPLTSSTSNVTKMVPKSSIPAPLPPLITLTTTNVSSSLTNASSSINKKNAINSFIISNTKIPSSLKISLTKAKTSAKTSPMTNLQKMVQQNFSSSTSITDQLQMNGAVKRSYPYDSEDGPKEKHPAYVSKTTKDDKKSVGVGPKKEKISVSVSSSSGSTPPKKVFSPDILPEVSITLNPHPESANKRLSPETSYDVSCFKPFTAVSNGIPSLTPINMSINATASKTILKSPIKNLNAKKNNDQAHRSQYLLKGRFSKFPSEVDSLKRNGSILEAGDTAKRPLMENGVRTPPSVASSSPLTKIQNSDCETKEKISPVSALKKDGPSRHQGIPKLIDINAPFAKSCLKFASKPNLTKALTIKPLPESSVSNNALDLTSPTNKSRVGGTNMDPPFSFGFSW